MNFLIFKKHKLILNMFGWCLNLIGFGVKGVIKGSLAAAIQSYYGLIKAGSLFAKLTSLAMSAA